MSVETRFRGWHSRLSEGAKLFYYGTLGNGVLSALDYVAHRNGGEGSAINGMHNISDVAAYGVRGAVASLGLSKTASERALRGVNATAIIVTSLVCAKNGFDLLARGSSVRAPETSAALFSGGSTSGNFIIAGALEPSARSSEANHFCAKTEAHEDAHHHARIDAYAGVVATAGVGIGAATGDYRFDSFFAIAGGSYFIHHMIKHMRHRHSEKDTGQEHVH